MRATITKIDKKKVSANGNKFIRVYFTLEDGKWSKTDLCPDFRNYARWKKLLKVGNILSGIELKNNQTVNADSFPKLVILPVASEDLINKCYSVMNHLTNVNNIIPSKMKVVDILVINFNAKYDDAGLAYDICLKGGNVDTKVA